MCEAIGSRKFKPGSCKCVVEFLGAKYRNGC